MKDFKQDSPPVMLQLYRKAHQEVFGFAPFVHKKFYHSLELLQDKLRREGYSNFDYAFTVVKLLQNWALSKDLKFVPVNTFVGDWAFRRFEKAMALEYVDLTVEDGLEAELYLSELMVAKTYVADNTMDGNVVSFSKVVRELRSLLSREWLNRYNGNGPRPVARVLDELCEMYGVLQARNYADLVRRILYG